MEYETRHMKFENVQQTDISPDLDLPCARVAATFLLYHKYSSFNRRNRSLRDCLFCIHFLLQWTSAEHSCNSNRSNTTEEELTALGIAIAIGSAIATAIATHWNSKNGSK